MFTTDLTPYAGRDPHAGTRVAVYKNLHRGGWSLKALDGPHKGTVVAHANAVALTDCAMHVRKAAQAKIAAGQPRQVHAWVIGRLSTDMHLTRPTRLIYRPHERPEFYTAADPRPVWTAPAAVFTTAAYIDTPK